jgi:hypothetical protein
MQVMTLQNVRRGRRKISQMPGTRKRKIFDTTNMINPSARLTNTSTAQLLDSVGTSDCSNQWLDSLGQLQPRFCPRVAKLILWYRENVGVMTLFTPNRQP